METYRTFLRSCRNWQEFANTPKIEQDTGLTLQEAREACKDFNDNRTESERENGTKLEFEAE
jgi:hypothetical protein